MKTIKASEFTAKCLQLMDEVEETGEAVVITKRGKPVARLVPVPAKSLIGLHEGQGEILGDIIGPLDVPWEVQSEECGCAIHFPAVDDATGPEEGECDLAPEPGKSIWGLHQGMIEITGDIVSPIYSEWAKDLQSSSTRTS